MKNSRWELDRTGVDSAQGGHYIRSDVPSAGVMLKKSHPSMVLPAAVDDIVTYLKKKNYVDCNLSDRYERSTRQFQPLFTSSFDDH